MKKILYKIRRLAKYYRSRETSKFVKKYYRESKNKNIDYERNIWNKNFYWDFFYQSLPHSVKSPNYVPQDYYGYKIEANLNDGETMLYVKDKNMYDKIFANAGVRLPKTIFRCYNGIFMDENYDSIDDIDAFIKSIKQDIIVKQANYLQGGGIGIKKFSYLNTKLVDSETNKAIDVILLKKILRGNFIAQEVVTQHAELAKYHPDSINSLKIYAYRSVKTNKIHVTMASLRMGTGNTFLDNVSNGGLSVGITIDDNDNAYLKKYGLDKWNNFWDTHPNTKVKFIGNKIPSFPQVVEITKKLSNLVPYQRLIGWDFCISEEGKPILIELNTGSGVWGLQATNGEPLFGKFTQEIKDYLTQKNL